MPSLSDKKNSKTKYISTNSISNQNNSIPLENTKTANSRSVSIYNKTYELPDDIVIYSSPDCFFCSKLKKMLYDNNLLSEVTIIEDRSQIPKEIDAYPYILSKMNNVEFAGCPTTIENFMEKVVKK